jgi:predicted amidohydrolase
VVLSSAHRLSGAHKPHNSLYVTSDPGQFAERYDKRDSAPGIPPGTAVTWPLQPGRPCQRLGHRRCGALISYDYRYPELYREYARRGVQLVFHSFPAAAASPEQIAATGSAIPAAQPGRHAHLSRHHHARGHDCRRGVQPRLDQLPELLGQAKLLASVLRARRRHHHGRLRRNVPEC